MILLVGVNYMHLFVYQSLSIIEVLACKFLASSHQNCYYFFQNLVHFGYSSLPYKTFFVLSWFNFVTYFDLAGECLQYCSYLIQEFSEPQGLVFQLFSTRKVTTVVWHYLEMKTRLKSMSVSSAAQNGTITAQIIVFKLLPVAGQIIQGVLL